MGSKGTSGQRRGPAFVGTFRWVVILGGALIGLFYLMVGVTPLTNGQFEMSATATDIDVIEQSGFPEARYLEVANGHVVFEYADVWISGRKDSNELIRLKAPVVSGAQLEAWRRSVKAGEPLGLSNLRLVAAFRREKLGELWPDVLERAEAGKPLAKEPAQVTLTGDTVVAKGQISLPTFDGVKKSGLDWSQARHLFHGVHHWSLGNIVKNLLIGLALIAISIFTFRYHRRHPTKASYSGLDPVPIVEFLED